jgi:hypothetical protein
MTTMTQRPLLQDMVKAAMRGTTEKLSVNLEAARQSQAHAGTAVVKTASAAANDPKHISTDLAMKLAYALGAVREQIVKEADGLGPGEGPNALHVMQATSSQANIDSNELGSATSQNQPPLHPALQAEKVQEGKANTGLETNDSSMHSEQPVEPIKNEKVGSVTALAQKNLAHLRKLAGLSTKTAEDAINPAHISSPASVDPAKPPPGAAPSGEGVPAEPSDVTSQKRMIASNEAAINYTKGEAKANPKSDVAQVLNEPPLSAAHDKVLQQAFDATGRAGVKISSAKPQAMAKTALQIAAQRAMLGRLLKTAGADAAAEKKDGKDKRSGMAPETPQAATGINAATMGT